MGPSSWLLNSATLAHLLKGTCQFLSFSSLLHFVSVIEFSMETQVFIPNTQNGYNVIQELKLFIMTWLDFSGQLAVFPT